MFTIFRKLVVYLGKFVSKRLQRKKIKVCVTFWQTTTCWKFPTIKLSRLARTWWLENNYLEQIRNAADSSIIVSCIVTIACITHSRRNCKKCCRTSETRNHVNCDINALYIHCWVNIVAHQKFHPIAGNLSAFMQHVCYTICTHVLCVSNTFAALLLHNPQMQ